MIAEHARSVEAAFEGKLAGWAAELVGEKVASELADNEATVADGSGATSPASEPAIRYDRRPPITKTVLHRNKEHLKFVRRQPCLVCGRQPSDPHHLRFAAPRALGRKVSDEFAVPLCRVHHREAHRTGKEQAWWQARGIAPLEVARKLWQASQYGAPQTVPPLLPVALQDHDPTDLRHEATAGSNLGPSP